MSGPGPLRRSAGWLALGLLAAPAAAQPRDAEPLECLVEPMQQVVVSAPEAAVVESVLVERGDRVGKGQVIAMLESSVEKALVASARARAGAKAELAAAEARREFEKSRHQRSRELHQSGVLSELEGEERRSAELVAEADLLRARENREQAALELARAEALLERRTIRSPIDGVVMRRLLDPGEYADPLDLVELAQIDPLRVEVFAPVSLLGQVKVGMTGRVELEAPQGSVHEARVVVVDPVVDAASGTFGVRLELPNPERQISAGLKCQVRFEAGSTAERRERDEPDPS